jgi:2-methylcitrate dehydratase PrpD
MYISEQIADFIVNLQYEDIPDSIVEMAKSAFCDAIGNMLYGRYSPVGEQALRYVAENNVFVGSASGVFMPDYGPVPLDAAIFAYNIMSRVADLDDGHRWAMGHPGSVLVPMAIAMGEMYGLSGKELVTALVIGYEVHICMGRIVNPSSYNDRNIDATGSCGGIAAAAMASRLLSLTAEQTKNALGICASFCNGLAEYYSDGTSGKLLSPAWAASNGLRAARLALHGFTGSPAAFEGKRGFFRSLAAQFNPYDIVMETFGKQFEMRNIYFKLHACMRGTHPCVDAVKELREEYNLRPGDVEHAVIYGGKELKKLWKTQAKGVLDAQGSLQYCAAIMLTHGQISLETVIEESLHDPEVAKLAGLFSLETDDRITEYVRENPTCWHAAKVVIHTKAGRALEKWMPVAGGEPEKPYSLDQLREKFRLLLSGTPMREKSEQLLEHIFSMDTS